MQKATCEVSKRREDKISLSLEQEAGYKDIIKHASQEYQKGRQIMPLKKKKKKN